MRIGYNTWSMATVPPTDFIPGLSDIGFTAIAISVVPGYTIAGQYVRNAADQAQLSADDRRRIKHAFEARDLHLPSLIGNQSLVEDDADRNAAAISRLRGTIDLCVELAPANQEVPTLNTGIAGHSGDLEAKQQLVLDRLGALTDYARERGVVVCIEPHVGGAVDTPARAEWLVRTIDSPALRLDFDVSHFEVAGIPMDESVSRLAPLAGAAEIKDQHFRYLAGADDASPAPDGWLVEGNGVGRATAPDGRPVEFQFLLGGEGTFDLPKYLALMQGQGFTAPIAFEASVQCQARPGYDALASATHIYQWMADGWRAAGIPER
ncbi:MAG: sugar phosphate isomerase/epimerase [Chloroflexota bacterium]|nr:sugar phosphate isomerase/epimerase [Chloroflexota bacterium]